MLLPFYRNIICMLNLLKKNCSAVACHCTCLHKKEGPVVCAPPFMWQWPGGALFRWLSQHPSCCFPLQLFRVVGSHVHALLDSCASAKVSVEPPLASMCSLDQEKVCLSFGPWSVAGRNALELDVSMKFIPKFTLLSGSHAPVAYCLSEQIFSFYHASIAKGLFTTYTGSYIERDDCMTGYMLHVCWRQLRTRWKKWKS